MQFKRITKMKLLLKSFYTTSVLLITIMGTALAQENAAPEIFGDWQVNCETDTSCRMAQTVVQTSTKRLILQIKVFKKEDPTLLLTFPLGILLSTGWQYQIDGNRETLLPFEICNSEGCHAGVKLTPKLLAALKRGNKLSIKFFDAGKNTVNPVISLAGFTKAYEALK